MSVPVNETNKEINNRKMPKNFRLNKNLPSNVEIYDSSLRDGAQSEGISFSNADKFAIITKLDGFGVQYIEAGNPGSNPKDAEFFTTLQNSRISLKTAKIVAFGSTKRVGNLPADDSNLKALIAAKTKFVTIFGKSWDFHVKNVLNIKLQENLDIIYDSIKFLSAKKRTVFFDAEHFFDGFKANPDYALQTIKTALAAGTTGVVLCDTNGGCFPNEITFATEKVKAIVDEFIDKNKKDDGSLLQITIGIHAHNDSDCATANSVAAVMAGANQVQGTFLGFGERAGNANLSAVIPNIQLKMGIQIVPDLTKLLRTSADISNISHYQIRKNTPYVGTAVFSHKAGMHADGVAKDSKAFEHISPEEVGNARNFLMSDQAGRASVAKKISEILEDTPKDSPLVNEIVDKIKHLEKSGYVFESADASFELMVRRLTGNFQPFFELVDFKVVSSQITKDAGYGITKNIPSGAIIKVRVFDRTEITADEGDGPVNAIDKALRKALEIFYPSLSDTKLIDYKVRIFDGNSSTAAITRVEIESTDGQKNWLTVGASKDIISASVIALSEAWEYILLKSNQENFHANGFDISEQNNS